MFCPEVAVDPEASKATFNEPGLSAFGLQISKVVVSAKAATGGVQGVIQLIFALHPELVTEKSEIKRKDTQPSGLVDVISKGVIGPQKRMSCVPTAPTVFPFQKSK